ncbi:putative carboxypeptidase [Naviculisporaceae sp. PSN 640]
MCPFSSFLAVILLAHHGLAQFAPHNSNLTYATVDSSYDRQVKISYKQVSKGVCNTAFANQSQITGWVSIPGEYPTNIFYWAVFAREPTNDVTVWLNGGPGSSSMSGFFTGAGPCEVVEKGAGRLETVARQWGWDRASNMVFFDQPNQVGFSYDTPVNKSVDFLLQNFTQVPLPVPDGRNPATFLNGTFPTWNPAHTANTTSHAARAMWHVMQAFMSKEGQVNTMNVSLFAESYGGRYGPVFLETWEELNSNYQRATPLKLKALGIVNGCVDDRIQAPYYTSMMVNNTYGINMLSSVEAEYYSAKFYQPHGCRDLIDQCRNATAQLDPENTGNIPSVNEICSNASTACQTLLDPYVHTFRDPFDITHKLPTSFPSQLYAEYLNTRAVQLGIGATTNFTNTASFIPPLFLQTGDYQRGPLVPKLAALLTRGIRIGLIYGDRDFICNWLGGEALSLAIASSAGGIYASNFPQAGYAPIIVNETYVGGEVRQFGNLSFSRIFQAGHAVPAYQPETAFQVFARILLGTDIGTGQKIDPSTYSTEGNTEPDMSPQTVADQPPSVCYIRNMRETCTEEAITALANDTGVGVGVVINGKWYARYEDWPGAAAAGNQQQPTPTDSNNAGALTGVYTATSTPKRENNAAFSFRITNAKDLALRGLGISCPLAALLVMF